MMTQLDLCEKIAREAHAGQKRRGGDDYIEHPRRVAEMFSTRSFACAAWLHDVLEDTSETEESLKEKGVSSAVIDAVCVLTKASGQSYESYIEGVSIIPALARIKIADMLDNLFDNPTEKQKDKYKKAIRYLYKYI